MRQFYVREPKTRLISAPTFRDRVVHHALVRVIEPLFERRFVDHSYACRVGRGTQAAVLHVQHVLCRPHATHVLKGDIRSYFASINHDALKRINRRTIRDHGALWLMDTIIDAFGPGLPIGALTSQLEANVNLDQLDHYVVDDLGWGSRYTRYMDDFIVIGGDRRELIRIENQIRAYVERELRLELNDKTHVFPARRGVDFCGYRIFPYYLKPRKRNVKRARRRLRKLAAMGDVQRYRDSVMSFLGYMKICRGHRTTTSILNQYTVGGGT
jgi:hypothetical protein